jgi:hypothetical protein
MLAEICHSPNLFYWLVSWGSNLKCSMLAPLQQSWRCSLEIRSLSYHLIHHYSYLVDILKGSNGHTRLVGHSHIIELGLKESIEIHSWFKFVSFMLWPVCVTCWGNTSMEGSVINYKQSLLEMAMKCVVTLKWLHILNHWHEKSSILFALIDGERISYGWRIF